MGPIVSKLESLPAEAAPGARACYAAAMADLGRLGLPVPDGKDADEITREELEAHIQEVAGELLGAYLAADPDGIVETAKSDAELAAQVSMRLGKIWGGVPYTPNVVTAADVASARMMGG